MVKKQYSKHKHGLGFQITVGDLISTLFPAGFLVNAYHARETILQNVKQIGESYVYDDLAAQKHFEGHLHQEKLARGIVEECVSREWEAINGGSSKKDWRSGKFLDSDSADVDLKSKFSEKYLTPPYTPFDLFAICGTLLRDSGAYHHIESEFGPTEEALSINTKHGRSLVSTEKDRSYLIEIGDEWREMGYKYRWAKVSETVEGEEGTILKCWSKIIASWNRPIFDPIPESENYPIWWRSAYELLCISDRAARDSGIIKPKKNDVRDLKPGYGGIKRGGLWASFAANLLADDHDEVLENFFSKFCIQQKIEDFEYLEWGRGNVNTLSAANRDTVCVLPKLRTSQTGCTIRSISHSLSLLPARGFIRASWSSQKQGYSDRENVTKKPFNLIVIPYPYNLEAHQFVPVSKIASDQRSGKFQIKPDTSFPIVALLEKILEYARKKTGSVQGVVFPEFALSAEQFTAVFDYLRKAPDVELLCAGSNQRIIVENLGKPNEHSNESSAALSSNEAVMVAFNQASQKIEGDYNGSIKRKFKATSHRKHHRWCLTEKQVIGYGLSSSLDPSIDWWEDIQIHNRKLPFMLMRDKWAVSTLICEDLARVDPAQQLVRAVGPNLILSLVMDGPQTHDRWSARYATVLADDPGSAVLTVNSAALIKRALDVRALEGYKDDQKKLLISLWRENESGSVPIEMPIEDLAACLTLYEQAVDEFTLDGRRNSYNSISLRLGNYFTIPDPS